MRDDHQAVWTSRDTLDEGIYAALFNLSDEKREISMTAEDLGIGAIKSKTAEDLWSGQTMTLQSDILKVLVPPHGARLFKLR